MQGYIDVLVNEDRIAVMGREYLLGELSVSLMNISDDVLKELAKNLVKLEQLAHISREQHLFYRKALNTDEQRKLEFALDEQIYLPKPDEWLEIHKSVCCIAELVRTVEIGRAIIDPLPADMVEKMLSDIEYDSDKYRFSWIWYLELLDITMGFVEDTIAVVRTFRGLSSVVLPGLRRYDTHHLAGAYHHLLFDDAFKGLAASANDPDRLSYTLADYMILQYVPMLKPGGKEFTIAEYFRMDNLQAVLKTDLLRGFMKGHFPRQCEHCGRYFLMTKGYRTRFCDMPSPENPNRTCKQMAYAKRREKEKPSEDPKVQSYKRCLDRLNKSCTRGSITPEQKKRLVALVEELYLKATTTPAFSNEEFEKALQSKQLYAQLGIASRSRGRPQKQQTEQTQQTTSKQK